MTAEPAKSSDPVVQLVSGVNRLAVQVQNLHAELVSERRTRRKANRRFVLVVAADVILSVLIAAGAVSLHVTQSNEAADRHAAGVAACDATNRARAGLRALIATEHDVWHTLVPPHPTVQQQQIIAGIDARYHAAAAALSDVDCTTVK